MKKSNLVKLFSILLMSIMVIMFTTNVWAEDNDFTTLPVNTNNTANTNSNNTNSANTNNSNTASNNSNMNRSNTNSANTNSANNTNNTNKSNNSSIYNNTNLPKTGIEDSIPVAMLVVVFGISAIYAYKKIRDYRNI